MAQAPQGAGLDPSPKEKGAADPHPGSGTLPEALAPAALLLPIPAASARAGEAGLGSQG